MGDHEHPAEEQTGAAARMRRYRARRKAGARSVRVDVPPETVEAFVENGWISREEARNSQILSDAVSDLMDCWARGTLAPNWDA